MKKLMMFFSFMFLATVGLLAQEVVLPESWKDLYDNYGLFFATYLGIAGVASFLSEYVIRLLRMTEKFWKVVTVSVIAVGLSFLASVLDIGYLSESVWWETALWGGLSALAASGARSQNLVFFKTLVDFLVSFLKSKEPVA